MENSYKNGKIYKIVKDDLVYIGSTRKTLHCRLANHQRQYKAYNENNDNVYCSSFKVIDGGVIELIENYPCHSQKELREREQYWIDNTVCINKFRAHRTPEYIKEKNKEYKKSEKCREKNKEYRQTEEHKARHKEYIKEYQKTEKHKEYQRNYRLKKKSLNK